MLTRVYYFYDVDLVSHEISPLLVQLKTGLLDIKETNVARILLNEVSA